MSEEKTEVNEKNEINQEEIDQEEQRDFYNTKYKELQDIPGIGAATITKLNNLGYRTVRSVAVADEKDLISQGLGEDTVSKLIGEARKTISLNFITGSELAKIRGTIRYLSTGIMELDKLLRGGIETKGVTSFYGEFGSGKSQMMQQLTVTVQLPKERGGLDGEALYIDSEHVFRPERVLQMAEYLGFDDPDEVLDKIHYAEAFTSAHQIELLNKADHIIEEQNVKLIIIDSGTGQFRSEYLGREMLAPRQQLLNKHLTKLMRYARAFDCAAVITNQVVSTPDAWAGARPPNPIGGHIVGHVVHSHIWLRKGRNNLRIAKVTDSPTLPEGEAPFLITDRGLEDSVPDDE